MSWNKATAQNKDLQWEMELLQPELTELRTTQAKTAKESEKYKGGAGRSVQRVQAHHERARPGHLRAGQAADRGRAGRVQAQEQHI